MSEIELLREAVKAAAVYIFFHDKSGGKWFTSAPTEYDDKSTIKKRFIEAVKATGIEYEGTPRSAWQDRVSAKEKS